jgi:hypothetical protein
VTVAGNRLLAVADELAVSGSFLRLEVVREHLVEALQANAGCVVIVIVANLRATPVALNYVELIFFFESFVHLFSFLKRGLLCSPRIK